MTCADRFNHTRLSRFINSRSGRVFRILAGTGFATAGLLLLPSAVGIALLAWSAFPLSAGAFDVCWISGALGGSLRGNRIRAFR